MKRILLFASALVGLFAAASCQQENLEPEVKGGVTYEITLPTAPQTKGESGYDVYDLYYEVYKTVDATALKTAPVLFEDNVQMNGNTTTITLELLNDQDYTILFWAHKQGTDYFYVENLREVGIKQASANNDDRDAFCGLDQIQKYDGDASRTVELTRPFAQINIATLVNNVGYDITPVSSLVNVKNIPVKYNVCTGEPVGDYTEVSYTVNTVPTGNLTGTDYKKVAMNYALVPAVESGSATVEVYYEINTANGTVKNTVPNVPIKKNYRTNIVGNLLTSNATYTIELKPGFEEGEYTVENGGNTSVKVTNTAEFTEAFADANMDVIVLGADINLNDLVTRATTDPTFTVASGKTLTIDLNGKKLSATSAQTGENYNMFDVRGTLTVMNGTMEYKHLGENMGWGASTNLFNVTAGGVLNLEGVTAKNLGGSDMGFVAHLNNWGEVTLNVENCTLESNYVPVRVFNSGYDMNNVTIKNSTLKGGSAAFWVHNYTVEDFGSAEKAEAQKALLNLSIYDQGNTFSPDLNGVRYGFTNSVRTDAYGITKTVSEDGTEVTLGSLVEDGLIRRGVAGAEENTTIKKVVVEEGVTTLYDRTFRRFYALETVELPSTLTIIGAAGSGVFQSCNALKNIVLPESVTVLGKGTFQECSSLESINIPAGVTRIESDCLRATGLKSVEFHAGVTYFGAQAFRDCKQLTEVIINAPEFTMEGNTFGITAAPFTPMTIHVANAEMKAYVESKLTAHAKTYITVIAPTVPETGVAADAALKNGENVTLESNLTFNASETTANSGYGATGLTVDGSVLNGNDHIITANNAWGTWDCTINAKSGTIKNVTVNGAMRGIFMGDANGDVYIDNVIFQNVIYTFNSDAGDKNYGVYISNSTLNGWTSFSNCHKEVVFTDCSFAKGNGNAFCRPYNPCVFENCEFSTDMQFDTTQQASIVFKNCTYGGVKITAENAPSLKTGDKTFFYNGVGTVSFE